MISRPKYMTGKELEVYKEFEDEINNQLGYLLELAVDKALEMVGTASLFRTNPKDSKKDYCGARSDKIGKGPDLSSERLSLGIEVKNLSSGYDYTRSMCRDGVTIGLRGYKIRIAIMGDPLLTLGADKELMLNRVSTFLLHWQVTLPTFDMAVEELVERLRKFFNNYFPEFLVNTLFSESIIFQHIAYYIKDLLGRLGSPEEKDIKSTQYVAEAPGPPPESLRATLHTSSKVVKDTLNKLHDWRSKAPSTLSEVKDGVRKELSSKEREMENHYSIDKEVVRRRESSPLARAVRMVGIHDWFNKFLTELLNNNWAQCERKIELEGSYHIKGLFSRVRGLLSRISSDISNCIVELTDSSLSRKTDPAVYPSEHNRLPGSENDKRRRKSSRLVRAVGSIIQRVHDCSHKVPTKLSNTMTDRARRNHKRKELKEDKSRRREIRAPPSEQPSTKFTFDNGALETPLLVLRGRSYMSVSCFLELLVKTLNMDSAPFLGRENDGSVPMDESTLLKKNGDKRNIENPPDPIKKHQRKILDVLEPRLEFEELNFSKRGALKAVERFEENRDQGYRWISYLDVKDCFHSIDPKEALELIDSRLGEVPGVTDREGIPVGHPISNFLADVYLDQFDKRVSKWPDDGCRVIRYVDDIWLMCRKMKEVRAYNSIAVQILNDLGLETRTDVSHVNKGVEMLGFIVERGSRRPQPEKVEKYKARVRALLSEVLESRGRDECSEQETRTKANRLHDYIHGWTNYFGDSVMPWTLNTIRDYLESPLSNQGLTDQ